MVNCVFNECFTNRSNKSGKYRSIAFFKLTARKSEFYQNWKKDILNVVTKCRHADSDLKRPIQNGNIYICEKHFKQEDIEITRE